MTTTVLEIARHPTDSHFLNELPKRLAFSQEFLGEQFERLKKDPEYDIAFLGSTALNMAGQLAAKNADPMEIKAALELVSKVFTAVFTLARHPHGEKTLTFDLPPLKGVELTTTGPSSRTTAARWQNAFHAALATDQRELLDELARVPIEIIRKSSTTFPECTYLLVEAMQKVWLITDDMEEAVIRGIKFMDRSYLQDDEVTYVQDLVLPLYMMLVAVISQDEADVNERLAFILTCHRDYYDTDEDARRNTKDAQLCLPALGWGRYAVQAGYDLHVHSPYMPDAIVHAPVG